MRNPLIDELLAKFLADEISGREMEQLLDHLREGNLEELQHAIDNAFKKGGFSHLAANSRPEFVLQNILTADAENKRHAAITNAGNPASSNGFIRRIPWAAAAAVLLFFCWAAYSVLKPGNKTIAPQAAAIKTDPTRFTRFIILPDSSTVVLKANSTLEFADSFTMATREVILKGEAYFDIRHNEKKPFIIHTGNVKTTVLGTAFDIKAFPATGQVTVSVARGKVKVEIEQKLIAVLLPDQQVVYSVSTAAAEQKPVNTNKIITDWTTEDMIFETVSMSAIVETLSKRYGVKIAIKNPNLKECPVKISFSGTETLTDVLTALCTITNARFTNDNKGTVLIDGEGCQ